MTVHDWFIQHRGEYAARVLEGDELARFEDHLGRCEDCASAVAELERDLAWLPMGATPAVPPPGMTRRLREGVLDGGRRRRWLMPSALAASVALAAFVTWRAGRETGRLNAEIDQLLAQIRETDTQLAATLDTLSVIRAAQKVMHVPLSVEGSRAGLVIFEDTETHRWTVVVHGIPEAPEGERYALWWVCEEGMREGTALPATMNGTAVLVVPMPQDLGEILAASITRETMPAEEGGMPMKKMEIHLLEL